MRKIKLVYGLEAAGGGALKHLVYLVTRLNNKKFNITVILSKSRKKNISGEIRKMEESGAQVLIIPMCRSINPISDINTLIKLLVLFNKEKPDIVHAHSSKAGGIFRLAAWICNVSKIYYTPHCFYFQGKTGFIKSFFVVLEKLLGKLAKGIIVSESEQKEAIKYKLAPIAKFININNAIDFDEYLHNKEIIETKEYFNIPNNNCIVGSIGRLVPQKDWVTYVYAAKEVLKKYPETVFLIVGEGELENEIQKLIFKLNLESNIIITGYIEDVYKIYGIIDILVNTSMWEGLPYVLLEAMQYKKPIVITDTGNENTIINKESGFISPVKDYKSISEKIITLIENKKLAIQMGQKGNAWLIEKYSFYLFIKQHEQTYLS